MIVIKMSATDYSVRYYNADGSSFYQDLAGLSKRQAKKVRRNVVKRWNKSHRHATNHEPHRGLREAPRLAA